MYIVFTVDNATPWLKIYELSTPNNNTNMLTVRRRIIIRKYFYVEEAGKQAETFYAVYGRTKP